MLARVQSASRPFLGPEQTISRAWWSSRRAIRAMATWRPMPRWCWPRTPARSRASWPRAIAEKLRADDLIAKVDVAGPGFINLTLKPRCLDRGAARGDRRGRRTTAAATCGEGEKVNVEYVSANPTGPMHVGHGRGAVFGDALANLLDFAGYEVTREYYINDAGAQVDVLARSAYPALPRGARRGHRRDPGRALSRRLSEAGRRGARRGIRRARSTRCRRTKWLPIVRAKAIDMMMDDDPRGSRRAQCAATTCFSPSAR